MALSYWIETMQTLSSPAGALQPGTLARQVGVEYLFPIVPPGMAAFWRTSVVGGGTRGFPVYMAVFFRIRFGYMVPGAFQLTLIAGGITAYNGTLTGYTLEEGIDYIYFMEPDTVTTAFITNLTNLNQRYEMISQYLIISSEGDYVEFKRQLEKMQFPYSLPEPSTYYK